MSLNISRAAKSIPTHADRFKTLSGFLLGLGATCIWGSFYIAGRWLFGEEGGETLNPCFYNLLRFAAACLFLLPICIRKQNRELVRRAFVQDWRSFFLLAAIGMVLESYLVFFALKFTTSARCSLMANFSPIATVLLAAVFRKEKITGRMAAGMIAGFLGITLAMSTQAQDIYSGNGLAALPGDLMALGSGFCWAFFTVYGTDCSAKYGGPVCSLVYLFLSMIIMLPSIAFVTVEEAAQHFTPRMLFGIIYTGTLSLAVATSLWYAALRRIKASSLGAFGYLSAMITFTLSHFMLREHFSVTFLISAILVISGIAMMMKNSRQET